MITSKSHPNESAKTQYLRHDRLNTDFYGLNNK